MKQLPRCTATNNDGTRCARRVSDGGTICHVHLAAANGSSVSPITQPVPFDALDRLKKIAAKDGHSSQVQALKLVIELEGQRNCSRCAARDADRLEDVPLELCTEEEHAELKAAAHTIIRIKQDLRVRKILNPPQPEPEPELFDIEEPVVEPAPKPTVDDRPTMPAFAVIEVHALPREKFAACGLYEENGVVTHTYGDEYAQKLLNLEIPYEDACRAHATGVKADQRLADHLHQRFLETS